MPLAPYVTLRAGGAAERFVECRSVDELRAVSSNAHKDGEQLTILGWGSNVLPSDKGVPGIVALNRHGSMTFDGESVRADCAVGFQELFLKCAQRGLSGMEFAVGIPGTLGGALVSNAGAYRSNVSALLTRLEVVHEGEAKWVEPDFMGFKYRDSILRSEHPPQIALLQVEMELKRAPAKGIYSAAAQFQRERIAKQPPPASAGSYFKNVNDQAVADATPNLPEQLREKGIVPAGYLLEVAGFKGARHGGAMFSGRHANFMLNVGGATATEIRTLAERAKIAVRDKCGVEVEEEALYIGDWSGWRPQA